MLTYSPISAALPLVHPGYVPGRWYVALPITQGQAGANLGATVIIFAAVQLPQGVTISDIATKITTASAGGNIKLAIYASDPVTKKPTGTALCDSGNISTAATGNVSATLGAPVSLPAGFYWAALMVDNATAITMIRNTAGDPGGFLAGVTALTSFPNAGNVATGYNISGQTFGAWPNVTSATFNENSAGGPLVIFKVSALL